MNYQKNLLKFGKKLKIVSKNLIMETSTQIFTVMIYQKSSQFVCLSVIINFIFRAGKNCYPPVFLDECKYIVKGKKMTKYITNNIEISSGSDRKDSDKENSNKKNSDEENFNGEN